MLASQHLRGEGGMAATDRLGDRDLDTSFARGFFSARRFPWTRVFLASLVCAGYYLGARLGLALTFEPLPISVLWPPNAILLATLLLVPTRDWWIVLVAALPAHLASE